MHQMISQSRLLKILKTTFCVFLSFVYLQNARAQSFYTCQPPILPAALRTVDVFNNAGLRDAIRDIQKGDRIVLHDGEYAGILLENINVGTAEHPVVFAAKNSRKAIVSGSVDNRNLKVSNCSYMHFYGIRFTNASIWGVSFGPTWAEDNETKGCRHMHIQDCEIDHARQELLKINGNSSHVAVICNELHHSGVGLDGKAYAEGIYIGEGKTKSDRTHDILIQGNHIHHIGRCGDDTGFGEAIDIKTKSYNITVVENLIQHVTVFSQSAITVHANDVDFPPGAENPNILISRNIIHDVRKKDSGWDGGGIWAGGNGIMITNNLIWDTYRESIKVPMDAGNTSDSLYIYHNTCFDVVDGRPCFAVNSGNIEGDNSRVRARVLNHITDDNSAGKGNFRAKKTDFAGPVTGAADAGQGTGSGFQLAGASRAIDAGRNIAAVGRDIYGTPRPQGDGFDMGAFEFLSTSPVRPDPALSTINGFFLQPNYPNPFNPATVLSFQLKEAVEVTLNIYDVRGQKIKTLARGLFPGGDHSFIWDGTNKSGKNASSGVYFARLVVENGQQNVKMLLVR